MNLSPLFWTLILLAVSISFFPTLASRARVRLKRQYPPIGQMIDIGGYHLHMQVEGEGSHTVIFDEALVKRVAVRQGLQFNCVRS